MIDNKCLAHNPCYSSNFASINYCHSLANNYPSGAEPGWWGTPFNTFCVQDLSPDLACCWVNNGLYGYTVGTEFYHWSSRSNIVLY